MLALLVCLALPWPGDAAAASTYYVSTGGSDSNPGTIGSPFRTMSKGLRSLFPGDTLIVRGGTYNERLDAVPYRAATVNAPVLVEAYPGERPVIRGVWAIRNADYWTFDGINATWNGASAEEVLLKIINGVGWSFRNAEVWGARSYANIYIGSSIAGQPSNWSLTGNCVHDTYAAHPPFQDHNLYLSTSPGPGLVERNIFFNASNGNNIKVGPGKADYDAAENTTIRNNTMYNAAQNLMVVWKSKSNVIERNLLVKATGKSWYPNLRGFDVSGSGNLARDNAGYDANLFLYNTGSQPGVIDGGGNLFPRKPLFDSTSSCAGFHPTDPVARLYGRYGVSGLPVTGDWDGNGSQTPGVVRGNVWSLDDALDGDVEHTFAFGKVGDAFVAGDWDGDGIATPGVVRGNVWYLVDGFGSGTLHTFAYGKVGDRFVVGDWDGDGDWTPGVVRGNVWYLVDGFGNGTLHTFAFGSIGDVAVVGDWDGDGDATPGVVRGNMWYLIDGFGSGTLHAFGYGSAGDVPVVGDWNGDPTVTAGVVRGSAWFLRDTNDPSSSSQTYPGVD